VRDGAPASEKALASMTVNIELFIGSAGHDAMTHIGVLRVPSVSSIT
jgi:hypothetical protein